jgi:hypothetical protein
MAVNLMDYIDEGRWKGRINYECKLCPYATISGLRQMLDHVRGAHFPVRRPAPSPIVAADRHGREVEKPPPPAEDPV